MSVVERNTSMVTFTQETHDSCGEHGCAEIEPKILNFDEPVSGQRTIFLDDAKTSYIKISCLPEELRKYATDNFTQMFNMHPEEKHRIILRSETVEVHRYQQSYLSTPGLYDSEVLKNKSYMFSSFDTSKNNIELPEQFKVFYDWVKSHDDRYNQVVANWYGSGNDWIAYHSDCEIGMIPRADISMISLYEKDDAKDHTKYRTISFVPKAGVDSIYDKINIVASHGLVITMCGDCEIQSKFRHGIESTDSEMLPRIGLSFRQYK
jgi:hypothetical protein